MFLQLGADKAGEGDSLAMHTSESPQQPMNSLSQPCDF